MKMCNNIQGQRKLLYVLPEMCWKSNATVKTTEISLLTIWILSSKEVKQFHVKSNLKTKRMEFQNILYFDKTEHKWSRSIRIDLQH